MSHTIPAVGCSNERKAFPSILFYFTGSELTPPRTDRDS